MRGGRRTPSQHHFNTKYDVTDAGGEHLIVKCTDQSEDFLPLEEYYEKLLRSS